MKTRRPMLIAGRFVSIVRSLAALLGLCVAGYGCELGGRLVTDRSTGLVFWQGEASVEAASLEEARDYCEALELELELDLDLDLEWRLPTLVELRSLVRGCPATETGGACRFEPGGACQEAECFLEEGCGGCPKGGGPEQGCYWTEGLGGPCGGYWSSSEMELFGMGPFAVGVDFSVGSVGIVPMTYVRCVTTL